MNSRITSSLLGMSMSGKTALLVATVGRMSEGVRGTVATVNDLETAERYLSDYDRFIKLGEFPQPNAVEDWALLPFTVSTVGFGATDMTIMDYRGGALQVADFTDDEERERIRSQLRASSSIYVVLSADDLAYADEATVDEEGIIRPARERREELGIRNITSYLGDAFSGHDLPPLCILLTKSDRVRNSEHLLDIALERLMPFVERTAFAACMAVSLVSPNAKFHTIEDPYRGTVMRVDPDMIELRNVDAFLEFAHLSKVVAELVELYGKRNAARVASFMATHELEKLEQELKKNDTRNTMAGDPEWVKRVVDRATIIWDHAVNDRTGKVAARDVAASLREDAERLQRELASQLPEARLAVERMRTLFEKRPLVRIIDNLERFV